jgi:hypothetical protein
MPHPFGVATHQFAWVGTIGEFMIAWSIKCSKAQGIIILAALQHLESFEMSFVA